MARVQVEGIDQFCSKLAPMAFLHIMCGIVVPAHVSGRPSGSITALNVPLIFPCKLCLRLTILKGSPMSLHKYRRELYLGAMMVISLSIVIASAVSLQGLMGLATTAAGVFVGVVGIGMYDTWYDQLAKAEPKSKLKSKR
jgi:hypothetical protein